MTRVSRSAFAADHLSTYIHTYIPIYIPIYLPIYIHTYIHAYIHTYHTYIHTYIHISTPSTRKGSHAESKASHRRKYRFFSNVLNSSVFYYTWFRKPNFRVQTRSEQYLEASFILFLFFFYGGSMRRSQNLEMR